MNTYTSDGQYSPAISVGPSGTFVVVWHSLGSSGPDSSHTGISAQRFDSSGVPVGSEFQVNTYTTLGQDGASVAVGPDDGFTIAWRSSSDFGSDDLSSVRSRRFLPDGTAVSDDFQVNSYTTGIHTEPSIDIDPAGVATVIWRSDGLNGPSDGRRAILGQRFGAAGTRHGGEFTVNSYTPRSQRTPSVSSGPDGEFVVVWRRDLVGLFGQRFNSDGLLANGEFRLGLETPGGKRSPAVAIDSAGNSVVVWESDASDGTDDSDQSIHCRRFRNDGTPIGTEFQVNTYTSYGQYKPSVSVGPSGEFVVVWESLTLRSSGGSSYGIHGRAYDPNGLPIGDEFQVNTYTSYARLGARVDIGPSGRILVAWESDGSSGTDDKDNEPSIQARIFGSVYSGSQCGDAIRRGSSALHGSIRDVITAEDALAVLQASVGSFTCHICICDVDSSGAITSSDALGLLREAVGIPAEISCVSCPE